MIQIVKLFIFAVFPFSQGKSQNNVRIESGFYSPF